MMAKKDEAPNIMINYDVLSRFRSNLSLEQMGKMLQLAMDFFHGDITREEAVQAAQTFERMTAQRDGKQTPSAYFSIAMWEICQSVQYGKESYINTRARNARGGITRVLQSAGVKTDDIEKRVKALRKQGMDDIQINENLKVWYKSLKTGKTEQQVHEQELATNNQGGTFKPQSTQWGMMF